MLQRLDIDDRKAAAVFSHRRSRRILLALVEQEYSSSALAALTQTPLNLLSYHLARFVDLRLVRMTRSEGRAGAPIKFYRATARSFFVPAELMGVTPGAALNVYLRESLDASLASAMIGIAYGVENGHARMRVVRGSEAKSVTAELWLDLKLSRADAAALAGDLRALLSAYEARSNEGEGRYIVHAALAPG